MQGVEAGVSISLQHAREVGQVALRVDALAVWKVSNQTAGGLRSPYKSLTNDMIDIFKTVSLVMLFLKARPDTVFGS